MSKDHPDANSEKRIEKARDKRIRRAERGKLMWFDDLHKPPKPANPER